MSAPFIGSRISLISKSDVRYEGILCGIDTSESKVYLQHVRCFGTEDRRKENPIAPATEVYEVIIFHSSDIKDLSVCELPPPVAYDPMFSHMGSGYPPQYGYPPMVHPQYGPQYGYPYGPYGHNYGMYPQSPSMMGPQDNAGAYPATGEQSNEKPAPISAQPPQKINVTTTKVESSSQSQPSSETHPADNNNETHDAQTHNADNHNNDNAKADVTPSDESHSQKSNNFYNKNQNNNQNKRNNNRNNNFVYLPKGEAQRNNQTEKSNDNTPNNNAQQPDSSANSDQQNNRQNNHNNQSDYRQKRGNSNNRGYKNYNNNRRGFDSRGHQNSSDQSHFHKPKEQTEPRSQEDFDFMISNSKFEKLSISALPGELEKELPKISPSYNKDSFYDNISCDTLDREDQKDKKTYYEQRKLDSETFGDIGRRQSNNRGGRTRGRYDTHSSQNNNQNNYSGNSNNNQRRYNNNYNNNNRGNRNYRGNKNASGNPSNASDVAAQN